MKKIFNVQNLLIFLVSALLLADFGFLIYEFYPSSTNEPIQIKTEFVEILTQVRTEMQAHQGKFQTPIKVALNDAAARMEGARRIWSHISKDIKNDKAKSQYLTAVKNLEEKSRLLADAIVSREEHYFPISEIYTANLMIQPAFDIQIAQNNTPYIENKDLQFIHWEHYYYPKENQWVSDTFQSCRKEADNGDKGPYSIQQIELYHKKFNQCLKNAILDYMQTAAPNFDRNFYEKALNEYQQAVLETSGFFENLPLTERTMQTAYLTTLEHFGHLQAKYNWHNAPGKWETDFSGQHQYKIELLTIKEEKHKSYALAISDSQNYGYLCVPTVTDIVLCSRAKFRTSDFKPKEDVSKYVDRILSETKARKIEMDDNSLSLWYCFFHTYCPTGKYYEDQKIMTLTRVQKTYNKQRRK